MQITWDSQTQSISHYSGFNNLRAKLNNSLCQDVSITDSATNQQHTVSLLFYQNEQLVWQVETHDGDSFFGENSLLFDALKPILNSFFAPDPQHQNITRESTHSHQESHSKSSTLWRWLCCCCGSSTETGYQPLQQNDYQQDNAFGNSNSDQHSVSISSPVQEQCTQSQCDDQQYQPMGFNQSVLPVNNLQTLSHQRPVFLSAATLPSQLKDCYAYMLKPNPYRAHFILCKTETNLSEINIDEKTRLLKESTTEALTDKTHHIPNADFVSYPVSADGACLFRAYLCLQTHQKMWLDRQETSQTVVLQKIESLGIRSTITKQIQKSLSCSTQPSFISNLAPEGIMLLNLTYEDAEQISYHLLGGSSEHAEGLFHLYNPVVLAEALSINNPSNDMYSYLELLCDYISFYIIEALKIPCHTNSTSTSDVAELASKEAYAQHIGTDHYNFLATPQFFIN